MNKNIQIIYNEIFYRPHIQIIKTLLHKYKNNQLILFCNKKNKERDIICNDIKLIKLLDNIFCEVCDNYNDYFGYCIEHYNQNIINICRIDFLNDYNKCQNKKDNFYKYNYEYYKTIKKFTKQLTKIYNYYFSDIFIFHNFEIQKKHIDINLKYLNNIYNIDYNSLNIILDDNICYKIIQKFNKKENYTHNIIVFIVFLMKKYKYDISIYHNLIKNPKNASKNTFIGNNNILYNKILNSKIINNIEFIETEKSININGHILRFDIYLILKVTDIYNMTINQFEIVIETDESHHLCMNTNEYDILKDEYCIKNGISMIHIDILNDKITDNEINLCIFLLYYFKFYKKPIYYFSEKYISKHQKINKIINNDNNDMNDNILTFGSNNKFDINKFKEINKIKNLDKLIKSYNLTHIINKFGDYDGYLSD